MKSRGEGRRDEWGDEPKVEEKNLNLYTIASTGEMVVQKSAWA